MAKSGILEEDMREYERRIKWRRWRNLLVVLLSLYFVALFVFALFVSRKEVLFYTETFGYDQLKQGQPCQMSFMVHDLVTLSAVKDYRVTVTLADRAGAQSYRVIDEQSAGRIPLISSFDVPEALPDGSYVLRLAFDTSLGTEQKDVPLTVKKRLGKVTVNMTELPPDTWKMPEASAVTEVGAPFRLRLIPENGRVAGGMPQRFFLLAQDDDHRPITDLRLTVTAPGSNDIVADEVTDGSGLAWLSYKSPLDLGSLTVRITRLDAKERQRLTGLRAKHQEEKDKAKKNKATYAKLRAAYAWPAVSPGPATVKTFPLGPAGTTIHISPTHVMIPVDDHAIETTVSVLTAKKPFFVEGYKYGQWISHWNLELKGPTIKTLLPLPGGSSGLINLQASDSLIQVRDRYDASIVFVTRIKEPKKQLLGLMGLLEKTSGNFDQMGVTRWKSWVDSFVNDTSDFNPDAVARAGLSQFVKPYYLPPLLYRSKTDKFNDLKQHLRLMRSRFLALAGGSGALVLLLMALRIIIEFRRRNRLLQELQSEQDTVNLQDEDVRLALTTHRSRIISMVLAMLLLAAVFAFVLYYLATLDWGSAWQLTQ